MAVFKNFRKTPSVWLSRSRLKRGGRVELSSFRQTLAIFDGSLRPKRSLRACDMQKEPITILLHLMLSYRYAGLVIASCGTHRICT